MLDKSFVSIGICPKYWLELCI